MSRILIPGGGGSGPDSSELSATAGDVIRGKSYVGADTDGEIGEGTLVLSGNAAASDVVQGKTFYTTNPKQKLTGTKPTMAGQTIIPALTQQTVQTNGKAMTGDVIISPIPNQRGVSQVASGFNIQDTYYTFFGFPEGYYVNDGYDWAPEVTLPKDVVNSALGVNANKIIIGQAIAGVWGSAREFKQWTGDVYPSSDTRTFTDIWGDWGTRAMRYLDLNLGFYPMCMAIMHSDGSGDDYVYIGSIQSGIYLCEAGNHHIHGFSYSDSGIAWNSTHVYIPVYGAASTSSYSYEVNIVGYA